MKFKIIQTKNNTFIIKESFLIFFWKDFNYKNHSHPHQYYIPSKPGHLEFNSIEEAWDYLTKIFKDELNWSIIVSENPPKSYIIAFGKIL